MTKKQRWLAAAIVCFATDAAAQRIRPQLDLRVKPVTEGVVTSLRTIDTLPKTPPVQGSPGGTQVGPPSDISPPPQVGAVVSLSSPDAQGNRSLHFGAAGTPEMQAYLAKSAQEVVVKMDDGDLRTFRPRDPTRFRAGQRVSVRSGELEPLASR